MKHKLTERLKQTAHELGFQLCGICPAVTPLGAVRLDAWLAEGYAGQMHYLANRREAYGDLNCVLPGVQSVIMLGMLYSGETPEQRDRHTGRVARYAWGERDYHDLIRERLHKLADVLRELCPECVTRGVVDTAPVLEREFAQLAGVGWVGKNTMLLSRHAGSYFFLAALLTDVELAYDQPFTADHCGSCTACLEACPTQAFPQPYVLNASRCISYLTIELQDPIPAELRSGMGDWVFGCDVCQEVCPWNRQPPATPEDAFIPQPDLNPMHLPELFNLDEDTFRKRYRHLPLWRAHRRGLLRNAAIVLGNRGDSTAIPALEKGLRDHEPIVRGAAAWALGQLGGLQAQQALRARSEVETDDEVRLEIEEALRRCRSDNGVNPRIR